MQNTLRLIVGLWGLMLLVSCAHSPQMATIHPTIDVRPKDIGQGKSISVQVNDKRPQKVIGSRGGVYADTAQIVAANDVAQALRAEVISVLTVYGFKVAGEGQQAETLVQIDLETLGYKVQKNLVGLEIVTSAILHVNGRKGTRDFGSRFRARSSKKVATTPSEPKNETLLNEILSKVLQRTMTDPEFLSFLEAL